MKKVLFMLLCAATIALVSCNENKQEEPTSPTTPTTEETEADFIIKFYSSDSLLKYTNFTIKDEKDLTLDCSNYTCAKPDTEKADSADWRKISTAISLLTEPVNLTADNIKIITLKVHLKKGHDHAFSITYTRNAVATQSPEIDTPLGGSAQKEKATPMEFYSSVSVHAGIEADKLTQFLDIIQNKKSNVISFSY